MNDSNQKDFRPVIGITIGDYNGIAPEVILKTFSDNRLLKHVTPVIYGDGRIFSFYRKHLNIQNFNYNQTKAVDKIRHRQVNVYNVSKEQIDVVPGKSSDQSGKFAVLCLKEAVSDLKEGHIQGLVTGPLSKETAHSDDFQFPGHTEYLTQEAEAKESLMFLTSDQLRVGVATGHVPLKDVPGLLTKDLIRSKANIMLNSLKKDFGIKKPRVAILGLNPHAGENGLLGAEETETIAPAIHELKDKGHLVFGPYPADGFFGSDQFGHFDGILAMYHDQGLAPFKSLAFETGVNYTAGLSFVRTSPDHGTAFSMAGKGQANEESMRNAVYLAKDIIKQRLS